MSRIVAPSHLEDLDNENAAATLHDHTYGITSDPLTQFAVSWFDCCNLLGRIGAPFLTYFVLLVHFASVCILCINSRR